MDIGLFEAVGMSVTVILGFLTIAILLSWIFNDD